MKLLRIDEVAQLVGLAKRTIYIHLSFRNGAKAAKQIEVLQDFPTPIRGSEGKRLLWLDEDIYAWLRSKSTFRPESQEPENPKEKREKRGRPRKCQPAEDVRS